MTAHDYDSERVVRCERKEVCDAQRIVNLRYDGMFKEQAVQISQLRDLCGVLRDLVEAVKKDNRNTVSLIGAIREAISASERKQEAQHREFMDMGSQMLDANINLSATLQATTSYIQGEIMASNQRVKTVEDKVGAPAKTLKSVLALVAIAVTALAIAVGSVVWPAFDHALHATADAARSTFTKEVTHPQEK